MGSGDKANAGYFASILSAAPTPTPTPTLSNELGATSGCTVIYSASHHQAATGPCLCDSQALVWLCVRLQFLGRVLRLLIL